MICVPLQRQMIRRGERNQKTRHPKVPLSWELIALLIRSRPKTILLLSKTASLFVSKPSEMEKEHKRSRDYLTLLEDIDNVVNDNVE